MLQIPSPAFPFPAKSLRARFALSASLAVLSMLAPGAWAQVSFNGVQITVGSGFNIPKCVAVDAAGDVFVTDIGTGSVYEMLAVNGSVPASPTINMLATGFSLPVGVAVDASGNVYVADEGAGKVFEIVAVGGSIPASPTINALGSGFVQPTGVAVDASGDVFVADQAGAVYEMLAVGGSIPSSSPTINVLGSGFVNPYAIALDASGDVFVGDVSNAKVYEMLAVGGVVPSSSPTINVLGSGFSKPEGIAVDAAGDVYVSDFAANTVSEMLAAGGSVPLSSPTIETLGSGFSTPVGVAVDGNGNVYVGDLGHNRVEELELQNVDFGPVAIGPSGATISVPFTVASSTTVGSIAVVTNGATGLEFADALSGSCTATTYGSSPTTCTVDVTFKPQFAGLRQGTVEFFSGAGNTGTVLASVPVYGVGSGPQIAFGSNSDAQIGVGSLVGPYGVAVDASGNVFIADVTEGAVYKVTPGGTQTLAASGFSQPFGVAVDGAGDLYVTDYLGEVYEVTPSNLSSTVGGGFNSPTGVAVDGAGNVYVASSGDNAIYKVSPAGVQSTVASGFLNLWGVAVDAAGNVYAADQGGYVDKIAPGGALTAIGTGWSQPYGVAVDAAGNVYVADINNGAFEVTPGGVMSSFSGTNLFALVGVALDGLGNVYFVSNTGPVTKIDRSDAPSLSFPTPTIVGLLDTADPVQTVQVLNIGNQPLNLTSVVYPADFSDQLGDATDCAGISSLAVAGTCDVPVEFTPLNVYSLTESVTLTDNALNVTGAQQFIQATGSGVGIPEISWTPVSPITYGTALDATELNAAADVAGDPTVGTNGFVYAPAAGTVLPVGTSLLSVSFTPADNVDFTTTSASVPITVTLAPGVTAFSATSVGSPSPTVSFSFLLANAVTLGANSVLTLGAPGLDFADAGTGSCVSGSSYAAGTTCTVDVIFTPLFAGLRSGAVEITDNSGNVLGTVYISGIGNGPQLAFNGGALSSIGTSLVSADGVAVDGAGNLYVADSGGTFGINPAVYKITPGGVQTPLGSGWEAPVAAAVDGAGNVYIADYFAAQVVEISPAGALTVLNIPYLYGPTSLAVDGAGNLYVADGLSASIYQFTPGGVENEIGLGSPVIYEPFAVAVDSAGNVYVSDAGQNKIFEITPSGTQTVLASNVKDVGGLAVDPAGNVYASSENPSSTNQPIYQIAPNGTKTTILKTGTEYPASLAIDGAGNLYIAYSNYAGNYSTSEIAKLDRADVPAINFPTATAVGSSDTADGAQSVSLENIGNTALTIPVPASGSNPMLIGSSFVPGASTCPVANAGDASPQSLAVGAACQLTVGFTPLTDGPITGNFALTDNNLGAAAPAYATQNIALSGTGTVIAWPPPAPIAYGTPLSATQLDATSSVPGNFVYTPAAGVVLPAGVQTLSATFTPDDLGLYSVATATVPITVLAPFTTTGTPVGGAPSSASYLFTFTSSFTLGPVFVSTDGLFGLDFADAGTGSCVYGTSYNPGDSCTVDVTFTPAYAGLRTGAIQLYDSAFNLIATDYISGMGQAPQIVFGPGTETDLADGSTNGPFFGPTDVVSDEGGNLYVADYNGGNVFVILWLGPSVGYGPQIPLASVGTNGPDFFPGGVAVDGAGNVYVADLGDGFSSGSVFEIPWNGASYEPQVTIANSTTYGYSSVFEPNSLAVDQLGNVYISDYNNGDVIEVPWSGTSYGPQVLVADIATNGGSFFPNGIAVDAAQNVYITDSGNNVVTEAPWTGSGYGAQTTLLPGATPPGFLQFFTPLAVAVDGTGDVYAADPADTIVVKLPNTGSGFGAPVPVTGHIGTEYSLDPCSVSVDQAGNLFIADCTFGSPTPLQVVKIDLADATSVDFNTPTPFETIDTADGPGRVFVSNIGNQPLTFSGLSAGSYPGDFPENGSDTKLCSSANPVAEGTICHVSMNFYPTSVGVNTGAILLTDNTLNQSAANQNILLSGTGTQATPSITWATPAAIYFGTALSGAQLNATAPISGTFTYTPALGAVPAIGTPTLSVLFTPDDATDYTTATATVQLTVNADVAAVLTSPAPGSILPGPSVTFTWSPGGGATGYQLWLGTTGVNSQNLYSSGPVLTTSATVTLPTNGQPIFARLYTQLNGAWQHVDYTFTEASQAALTTPAPGSTLGGPTTTFSWTPGGGATGYQIWIGSALGTADIYSSGPVIDTSFLSVTRTNLPINGETIYVRLFTYFSGVWTHQDYSYVTATQATMITPVLGATLTGSSATFTWSAGTGASGYEFWVGTTAPGSQDLYSSGERFDTSFHSATVNNIPTNGHTIYARLYTVFGGILVHIDYTFTEANLAAATMTSPAQGSLLSGFTTTFTWSAGTGATDYQLWLGSTGPGSNDVYSSGDVTSLSVTPISLPTNGEMIYARLYTKLNGVFVHQDYTFTAPSLSPGALTAPSPGGSLPGPSTTFTWSAGAGASGYQFWLGSTGVNSQNIYSSGVVTGTSLTINNLPTNGEAIYVRLYTLLSGVWKHADYTFTAATTPALLTPAPGSALTGSTQTFTWSAGSGVTAYQLWLGSTGVNSQNLYSSGVTTATSKTVNYLPTNGETIYARLYVEINGFWNHLDSTYTAAPGPFSASYVVGTPLALDPALSGYNGVVQGTTLYLSTQSNSTTSKLIAVDLSTPAAPQILSSTTGLSSYMNGIAVAGNYVYVTYFTNSMLQVWDVTNPNSPTSVGTVATCAGPYGGLVVQAGHAYVPCPNNGGTGSVSVIDLSTPAAPAVVATITAPASTNPDSLAIVGQTLYISAPAPDGTPSQILAYSIASPASPTLLGSTVVDHSPQRIVAQGTTVLAQILDGEEASAIDFSIPATPGVANAALTSNCGPQTEDGSAVQGNLAFIGCGVSGGIDVLDVSNIVAPRLLGKMVGSINGPTAIVPYGKYIYAADSSGKLYTIDYGGS